jgi:hypothetical protein
MPEQHPKQAQREAPASNFEMTKFIFITVIPALLGCGATVSDSVRQGRVVDRATFDLDCPKANIEATAINDTTWGARGCGRKALYVLDQCNSMNWASVCKALLDGEIKKDE